MKIKDEYKGKTIVTYDSVLGQRRIEVDKINTAQFKYYQTIGLGYIFEKENKHYITVALICDYDSGELKIMEPNKCLEWKWFSVNDFPKPLFLPTENLLKQKTVKLVNE